MKPHFIPELEEEGLSLTEIANSLGQKPKTFRFDFKRSFKERCELLNFNMVAIETFNDNNVLFTEFVVTTDCAKWLVAKSNTPEGDSYTKFLIMCEKKLLAATPIKIPTQLEYARQVLALLETQEHVNKCLVTSKTNNAKLTRENKLLKQNLAGLNEFMSMSQFKTSIQIYSTKCANSLVRQLKNLAPERFEMRVLGKEPYPTTCFEVEFLKEQESMIKAFFQT